MENNTTDTQTVRSKIMTVLGATLYMLFLGTVYIIGSISPYLASYFAVDIRQTQLLLPSLILVQTLVMPFGAQLASKLQCKWIIIIASSIAITSTFLASLVPRTSFITFSTIFVGGLSVCVGLSYTVPIKLGWRAFPERSGLVSGVIIGGFGLGSLTFTYMATMIVNPHNLNQVEMVNFKGIETIAFPDEVALKVPDLLRYLSLCFVALVLLSLFLITDSSDCQACTSDDNANEPVKSCNEAHQKV